MLIQRGANLQATLGTTWKIEDAPLRECGDNWRAGGSVRSPLRAGFPGGRLTRGSGRRRFPGSCPMGRCARPSTNTRLIALYLTSQQVRLPAYHDGGKSAFLNKVGDCLRAHASYSGRFRLRDQIARVYLHIAKTGCHQQPVYVIIQRPKRGPNDERVYATRLNSHVVGGRGGPG